MIFGNFIAKDTSGRLRCSSTGTARLANGTPLAGALLAFDPAGAVAFVLGGLPFTAAGKLACATVAAITGYSQGLPIAGGKVAVSAGAAVTSYRFGLPFSADGRLALAAAELLGAFSDGYSEGFLI